MIDLNDFITTNTNQAVSYDGVAENTGQCEQLVCCYWRDVYGFKCPLIQAAKDLWTDDTVLTAFDRIPVGQEQAGDVGVWDASTLINSPEFGHTDIVISRGFLGFDSNWGGVTNGKYPVAHKVQHNYTDVLGFLRYKGEEMVDDAGARAILTMSTLLAQDGAAPDRQPTAEEVTNLIGRSYVDAIAQVMTYDPYKHNVAKVKYYDADVAHAGANGVNRNSVQAYITEHLT